MNGDGTSSFRDCRGATVGGAQYGGVKRETVEGEGTVTGTPPSTSLRYPLWIFKS